MEAANAVANGTRDCGRKNGNKNGKNNGIWETKSRKENKRIPSDDDDGRRRRRNNNGMYCRNQVANHHHRQTLLVIFLAFFAGWLVVVFFQVHGDFMCHNIYVQFGDEFSKDLGTFSGVYQLRHVHPFFQERVIYTENSKLASSSNNHGDGKAEAAYRPARFEYCEEMSSWVFVRGTEPLAKTDPCRDWIARSPETYTFDLTSTASEEWLVRKDQGGLAVPFTQFAMLCYDCDSRGAEENFCGGEARGFCRNNKCECHEDWFGLRCESRRPCGMIATDERLGGFVQLKKWSIEFHLLTRPNEDGRENGDNDDSDDDDGMDLVEVYGRPVFVNKVSGHLIFFAGRRWVLAEKFEGFHASSNFHGCWTRFTVLFVSEAVDVDTPADVVTPVGLDWFHAEEESEESETDDGGSYGIQSPDRNSPIDATLLCAVCDNATNTCHHGGICSSKGQCQCDVSGSTGRLCQITPDGNGRCNEAFNRPDYSYDGGDCCEETCVGSVEFTCGGEESGDSRDAKLYDCRDPDHICLPGYVCMWQNGDAVTGEAKPAKSGSTVVLSSDGTTMAVGEPGLDTVRVFEKDGRVWKRRGRVLTGSEMSRFGSSIALSSEGNVVAIGGPKSSGGGMIALYGWDPSRDGWKRLATRDAPSFGNETHYNFGTALSISDEASATMAVAVPKSSGTFEIEIWNYHGAAAPHLQHQHTITPAAAASGGAGSGGGGGDNFFLVSPRASLSLSSDGNTILTQGSRKLAVQVYRKEGGSSYSKLGRELPGCCALLSGDGRIVALLAEGSVRTYHLNISTPTDAHWAPFGGSPIENALPLALSFDGKVLAVKTDAVVRLFLLGEEDNWQRFDDGDVPADGDASSAALSSTMNNRADRVVLSGGYGARTILAVGNPSWGGSSGSTSTYALVSPKRVPSPAMTPTPAAATVNNPVKPGGSFSGMSSGSPCELGKTKVTVVVVTDDHPTDTTYELVNVTTGTTIAMGGPFFEPQKKITRELCIAGLDRHCLRFTVFDDVGDGIRSPGYVELSTEGKVEMRSSSFGWALTHRVGMLGSETCDCNDDAGCSK